MRIRTLFLAVLVVPVLAVGITACGGGEDSATATTTARRGDGSAATSSTVRDHQGDDSGSGSGSGDVDCDALTTAGAKMTIQLQLLASMNSPEQVESVTQSPVVALDLDGLDSALETMHQLDGYDEPPFGSPEESIDDFQKAATDARALIASNPDAAAVDSFYKSDIVSPTEFLMKQSAISAALDSSC